MADPHVKIDDISPVVSYSVGAGGSTGPFAIPFAFFAAGDIKVKVGDTLLAADAYTVTGTSGNSRGYPGGSVTLATAAVSTTVTVYREVEAKRTSDHNLGSPLEINTLNTDLDKAVAVEQELRRDTSRGLKLPFGDSVPDLPAAASRANKVFRFDADGNPRMAPPTEESAAAAQDAADAAATALNSIVALVYGFFSSRAAAIAADPSVFPAGIDRLVIYGWATAGDGFFGIFKKVAADPGHSFSFQAGGLWWEQEMEGKSVTLLHRGADRYNTTDATDAIQKCVEYADAIWCPPGSYKVDGQVNFTKSGLHMSGPPNAIFNINNGTYGFGFGQDGNSHEQISLVGFTVKSSRSDNYLFKIAHIDDDLNFVRLRLKNGFNHFKMEEGTYGIDWDRCIHENSADYAQKFMPTTFGFCNSHSIRRPEFYGCIGSAQFTRTTAVSVVCPRVERWLSVPVPAGAQPSFYMSDGAQDIHFDLAGGYIEDHSGLYHFYGDGASSISIKGRANVDIGFDPLAGLAKFLNGSRDVEIKGVGLGLTDQARAPIDLGDTVEATVENIRCFLAADLTVPVVSGTLPTKQRVRNISRSASSAGVFTAGVSDLGGQNLLEPVAYANLDGATGTLNGGFGIASVVRNAAGDYTFTLTDAMANSIYTVQLTGTGVTNGTNVCLPVLIFQTTTTIRVQIVATGPGTGGLKDGQVMMTVFGRRAAP